jgi:hypothetical protein
MKEGKIMSTTTLSMEHDNPEFEEAFGIYVGPATYDEGPELSVTLEKKLLSLRSVAQPARFPRVFLHLNTHAARTRTHARTRPICICPDNW